MSENKDAVVGKAVTQRQAEEFIENMNKIQAKSFAEEELARREAKGNNQDQGRY